MANKGEFLLVDVDLDTDTVVQVESLIDVRLDLSRPSNKNWDQDVDLKERA